MSQHIGAPAQAVVIAGDEVTRGQMIAQPAQGLSVGIHASVSGKVTEVTDRYIIIYPQSSGKGRYGPYSGYFH